ncbi:poly-beta-1,6 N-acetyl-D-glucosamine synthase [Bradyrhizobium diazoefficiens]|nr:poly-beta-1,6-N-acetyl-D-glucosamine synthase [Bradyrhizobium diazoefficiens]MBR0848217.1 poly-beta-1,6 N-acetyl-D-glucosamine synthase [Bradyrhizobium diazoefficiens]
MDSTTTEMALTAIAAFCFGYPFVMAWYWMLGGVLFYIFRERHMAPPDRPPPLDHWPPISILVPCHNEADNAAETMEAAAAVDYPEFEVIAINDGSRDNTAVVLDQLAARIPRLRVVHLASNQGKAIALNVGATLARHELLVCIDGDALLDPHALRWIAHAFRMGTVGGLGGNPRIRNRSTLLGRLQVGEFAAIIGLIRRAQTVYGRLFTVSGVICAFRKRALEDAGWWSPRTFTDDIDITWRVELAGWRVMYEPNALVWILMPETLRGLWRQRLRWAQGGVQMMQAFFRPLVTGRTSSLWPTYINYVLSVAWSYVVLFSLGVGILWALGLGPSRALPASRIVPEWWGLTLALTYLVQALVSHLLDSRYERGMLRSLFWVIWYPLAFWLLTAVTAAVALPLVLLQPKKERSTWISPDRGLR